MQSEKRKPIELSLLDRPLQMFTQCHKMCILWQPRIYILSILKLSQTDVKFLIKISSYISNSDITLKRVSKDSYEVYQLLHYYIIT